MNKLLKKFTVGLLLAVFTLGITGCGNTVGNENKGSINSTSSVNEGETKYPVKITDSFGTEITLEKEPQKVISIAPNITEMIFDIKAEDKLVGRTDYCDYPEDAEKIESIGTMRSPDVEKIISLEPDLVIASTHFNEENAKKLQEAGIKVISLYEENDVTGVYTMLETLGTALNKNEQAKESIDDMKKTINEVTSSVNGLQEPTVYYVVGYGESGDFSAPENTFVGGLIKLAGGKDIVPASDSWTFSLEALLEADPDIIVLRNGEKEQFMTAEGYKELTAVKEGRVYEIDNNLIDRQGYRNAEGVLKLAEIFHPEAFK
ncbi:ABC transporter substrate-binding protein [uncultured Clostridium sp.]|uniref:ABC transporter substrate-binding protein n=1 Tax=uncultured Clostridium sp. TaxID=59620 RepID=UPI0025D0382D|nr:ABC transporter substrate-binding protein [uncultured Clostridium sp.]